MWKKLAALAVAIFAGSAVIADICINTKLGECSTGGISVPGVSASLETLYDGADIWWDFNGVTLGLDRSGNGNDINEADSPESTTGVFPAGSLTHYLKTDKDNAGHLEEGSDSTVGSFTQDEDFTISFWINYLAFETGGSFVFQKGNNLGANNWIVYRATGDRVQCFFHNDSGSTAPVHVAGSPAGESHFYTCTYTASDRQGRIYRDGVLQNTAPALVAGTDAFQNSKLRIGDRGTVNNIGFAGRLDDVVIHARGTLKDTAWMLEVYDSGAGTWYAAYMDFIHSRPRFAWSAPPEIRR